jgi:hypothetical protein
MTRIKHARNDGTARAVLPAPLPERETAPVTSGTLGDPLGIRAVAELVGCSTWTVRQVLVPRGLPCFRCGPNGKLIFYRQQVVRWITRRQRAEGGET